VVVRGDVPEPVRKNMELWVGCVAGALEEKEFARLLDAAGFDDIDIEPTRIYTGEDAATFLTGAGLDTGMAGDIDGRIMSAFIRATKAKPQPAAKSCCGPECCA
jgi:arsenite methyltransferase